MGIKLKFTLTDEDSGKSLEKEFKISSTMAEVTEWAQAAYPKIGATEEYEADTGKRDKDDKPITETRERLIEVDATVEQSLGLAAIGTANGINANVERYFEEKDKAAAYKKRSFSVESV